MDPDPDPEGPKPVDPNPDPEHCLFKYIELFRSFVQAQPVGPHLPDGSLHVLLAVFCPVVPLPGASFPHFRGLLRAPSARLGRGSVNLFGFHHF